jgi:hypothetical protein
MDELYLSRRIRVVPHLNLATDCWVPRADVFWEESGKKCQHMLTGPDDRFKTIDEAVIYAIESARRWINEQVSLAGLHSTGQLKLRRNLT